MNARSRLQHAGMPSLTLLIAVAATTFAQEAVPTRAQIRDKYKWDLTAMFADSPAWEADFHRAQEAVANLEPRQGTPLELTDELLATLTLRDDTRWVVDKLLVYASQLSDQDTRDNAALALKSRATALQVSYQKATAWIEPALLAIPEDKLLRLVAQTIKLGFTGTTSKTSSGSGHIRCRRARRSCWRWRAISRPVRSRRTACCTTRSCPGRRCATSRGTRLR